jgi:hypothetical protein
MLIARLTETRNDEVGCEGRMSRPSHKKFGMTHSWGWLRAWLRLVAFGHFVFSVDNFFSVYPSVYKVLRVFPCDCSHRPSDSDPA